MPLILRYTKTRKLAGSFRLNVGDEAHVPGVAFCGNFEDALLIPDAFFLASDGYARDKERSNHVSWDLRRPVALWRGSTTGYHYGGSITATPRIKLCLHVQGPPPYEQVDAGITEFAQLRQQEEIDALSRLKIMKEYVPADRYKEWRYHIDIDGNSNSWSGLFLKLLSGGVVLKVTSYMKYRQWYYDRLVPFGNYIPISEDFSDLIPKIDWLRQNDSLELTPLNRTRDGLGKDVLPG